MMQSAFFIDLPQEIGEVLIDNDRIKFKAASWCMFPVIWAGDILKIKSIAPENAREGDIVLYKQNGRAFSHRLVKRCQRQGKLYFLASGEKEFRNQQSNDEALIPAETILGKVVEIRRGKLRFKPDEIKFSFWHLLKGKVKYSWWAIKNKLWRWLAKGYRKLQRNINFKIGDILEWRTGLTYVKLLNEPIPEVKAKIDVEISVIPEGAGKLESFKATQGNELVSCSTLVTASDGRLMIYGNRTLAGFQGHHINSAILVYIMKYLRDTKQLDKVYISTKGTNLSMQKSIARAGFKIDVIFYDFYLFGRSLRPIRFLKNLFRII